MIKILNTKINKKGEPLNYFYMERSSYPSAVKAGISVEDETSFIVSFFKQYPKIEIFQKKKIKVDLVYFPRSNTYGVSERFKKLFKDKLKAEFFPTSIDGYYLMVVDNIVDCVDKHKSKITYFYSERRCTYEKPTTIILNEDLVENELLFSIPEEPLITFCSEKFIKLCQEYNITNVIFDDLASYMICL